MPGIFLKGALVFTIFKDLKPNDRFVAFLATIILLLFAGVAIASMFFPVKTDAEIKQTVIALVMLAAGFYLGSSASSRDKDKTIADVATASPSIAPTAPLVSSPAPAPTAEPVAKTST
jgi:apolipoprotein N-acyltransferase